MPRRCTSAERLAHAGCEAGEVPAAGACVPAAPQWTCPPGFVTGPGPVNDAGLPACEPDPADCGTDAFGGVQDAPNVRFLDINAPKGGDGTRAKPLNSLSLAVAVVPAGGTLAIAAGTYPSATLSKPITLVGRCAAMVSLVSTWSASVSASGSTPGLRVVRSVTLTGSNRGASSIVGHALELRRVWVHATAQTGLYAAKPSSSIAARECVIDEGGLPTKMYDDGVQVRSGAQIALRDVRISGSRGRGAYVRDAGTALTARDVLIDGVVDNFVAAASSTLPGHGILLSGGARVDLRRVRVLGCREIGVQVGDDGTVLTAVGLDISHSRPSAAGKNGNGMLVSKGARADIAGARIWGNQTSGIYVTGALSTARLTGLLAGEQRADPAASLGGYAVHVHDGAHVELLSSSLVANTDAGVAVGKGARLSVQASLITQTKATSKGGAGGSAVVVLTGGRLDMVASRLTANAAAALACHGQVGSASPTCRVVGTLIDGTRQVRTDYADGHALIGDGISLIDGSRLHSNTSAAVACLGADAVLRVAGTVIDATRPAVAGLSAASGAGLVALDGCAVELISSRIAANRAAGVQAYGASLNLIGVTVVQTAPEVALDGSAKAEFADGLMAISAPSVAARDCVFSANARAGIVLQDVASAVLERSIGSGSEYGLVAQGTTKLDAVSVLLTDNHTANRVLDKALAVPAPPKIVMP